MNLTGIPKQDWLQIRKLFQQSAHRILQDVYEDARFIRLLNRASAFLSEKLAASWRQHKAYVNAVESVEQALTEGYFALSNTNFEGIFVIIFISARKKHLMK